jgi:hypothetical protein
VQGNVRSLEKRYVEISGEKIYRDQRRKDMLGSWENMLEPLEKKYAGITGGNI